MIIEISILTGVLAIQVTAALLIFAQLVQSSADLHVLIEAKIEADETAESLSKDSDSIVPETSVPESENDDQYEDGFLIGTFEWDKVAKVHSRLPEMEQPGAIVSDYYFWLKSLFPSQLLERIFVVAPLVGVLITCIGFMRNDIDPEDLKKSMSPLLLGVGGGALLALVNQALLFFVDWKTTRLSMIALSLLPSVCSQDEGQKLRELSLENLGRVVEALQRSATHHEEIASDLKNSIEQVLLPINTKILESAGDMSGASSDLVGSIQTVVTAAYDLNSRMGTGLSDFEEFSKTVSLLRDMLDQNLGSLIERQGRAVTRLTESAKNLDGSTKMLTGSTQGLDYILTGLNNGLQKIHASTEFHTKATDRVLEVLDNQLQPSFEKIKDAIGALSASKEYLEEKMLNANDVLTAPSIETSNETSHSELIEALNKLVEEIKSNNDRHEKRGFLW